MKGSVSFGRPLVLGGCVWAGAGRAMSTAKGRMGGQYGRIGGQLSGASRARAALGNVQSVRVVSAALGSRKEGSQPQHSMNIMRDAQSVAAVAQALASEQIKTKALTEENKLVMEENARLKAKLAAQQQQQRELRLSAATAPSARAARSARRSSAPEAPTPAGAEVGSAYWRKMAVAKHVVSHSSM